MFLAKSSVLVKTEALRARESPMVLLLPMLVRLSRLSGEGSAVVPATTARPVMDRDDIAIPTIAPGLPG